MNKSFTLIEILVVIVIIGIISAFIIVSMSGVSEKANIAKSQAFASSLRNSLLMNLVSEWKLDDASGTSVKDSWGTNAGTWNGAGGGGYTSPSWRTASECVSRGCLAFDGTDDYINIPNAPSLNFTNAITMSLWFKTDINQSSRGILTKGYPGINDYDAMLYVTGGMLQFYIKDSDGNSDNVSYNVSYHNNQWKYLVGFFNGDWLYLYLNGIVVASKDSLRTNIRSSSNPTTIGYGWSFYFNGLIDESHMYNQAISTSQVQQNYYIGLNNLLKNESISQEEYLGNVLDLATR
ncbi:MAG: LamG domain-containing protein [Candidatus Pacebacteria bacterium]|nr:LamG domain-containing protein [Candidatus Paceibacterota bacterium]MDD5555200.1 LamG domain-containing protein [Candidatus Paceibacterota bacterium]